MSIDPSATMPRRESDAIDDAAWAAEELRRAEAHLARRRQSRCGPSDTDRQAWRFVLERSDSGESTTPKQLADHLGITTASTTKLLQRMKAASLLQLRANPDDRRSKLVVPVDRNDDPDLVDPLTTEIRGIAQSLSGDEARIVASFLRRVVAAVDEDCR